MRGLADLIEAAISLGAREHHPADRGAQGRLADVRCLRRAERRPRRAHAHEASRPGVVRADVVADDLPRIIAMLYSVLCDDGFRQRRLAALRRPTRRFDLYRCAAAAPSRGGAALRAVV